MYKIITIIAILVTIAFFMELSYMGEVCHQKGGIMVRDGVCIQKGAIIELN